MSGQLEKESYKSSPGTQHRDFTHENIHTDQHSQFFENIPLAGFYSGQSSPLALCSIFSRLTLPLHLWEEKAAACKHITMSITLWTCHQLIDISNNMTTCQFIGIGLFIDSFIIILYMNYCLLFLILIWVFSLFFSQSRKRLSISFIKKGGVFSLSWLHLRVAAWATG